MISDALEPEELRSKRAMYASQQIQKENVAYLALTSLIPLLGWGYSQRLEVMAVVCVAALTVHVFVRVQLLRRDYAALRVRLYDVAIERRHELATRPATVAGSGNGAWPAPCNWFLPTRSQLKYREQQRFVGALSELHLELLRDKADRDPVRIDEAM
jgi:hypothetical protein